jgi:DHA2 family lincomycin resistance protein-like MFS transporter
MGLLGPVIGRIYDRFGTRVLLIPGSIISSATLWYYTTLGEDTSILIIVIAQTLLSVGLAFSFTPLFTASLASLEPRLYSYGSAVLATTQQVAGAAGIALLITVMSSVAAGAVAEGIGEVAAEASGVRAAFMISAIVSTVAVVLAFFIRKPADSVGAPPVH